MAARREAGIVTQDGRKTGASSKPARKTAPARLASAGTWLPEQQSFDGAEFVERGLELRRRGRLKWAGSLRFVVRGASQDDIVAVARDDEPPAAGGGGRLVVKFRAPTCPRGRVGSMAYNLTH